MKPVIIIGGGFSGIISLKICLENGLDAQCYEKLDDFGGLWRYREDTDLDGIPSVTQNTIIDTSKEVGAISDFPPPDDFPNYMHNTKMIEYLGLYIAANNLQPRIHYKHEILKIKESPTYKTDGGWTVWIKNMVTEEVKEVEARAVMVCTGHHAYPSYPTFKGQELFRGTITHSHSFKTPSAFEGQRVVVVGAGNSAMDAAAELSFLCKQVYLSTRRGAWISPRMGPNGAPADFSSSRFNQYFYDFFPNMWRKKVEKSLNCIFDHEKYGIKPKHRCDQQHPAVSDIVPPRILAGAIKVKGDIDHLTGGGVVFQGEDVETQVDAIVACTGYDVRIPFLPQDATLPGKPHQNNVSLFARIFPVNFSYPTLAFITMTQPIGPLFPLMELQARWVSRLVCEMDKPTKNLAACGWPTRMEDRLKEVERFKASIAKRYVESKRHTFEVDFVTYTDFLAKQIGCKPNLFMLAFTDPALWNRLMFGPPLPYQFRLRGPHSWPKARETLMNVDRRVQQGLTDKRPAVKSCKLFIRISGILAVISAVMAVATHYNYIPDAAKFVPWKL